MTKQRHSDSSLRPSRLYRLLLLIFVFKLTVLGLLICEPIMPSLIAKLPGISQFYAAISPDGPLANAATTTGEGAGASPAVTATLPDVGMQRKSPGVPSSSVSPGAVPGVASTVESEPAQKSILPSIGAKDETAENASKLDNRDSAARKQEDLSRKEQELRVLEGELSDKLEKMKILENRLGMMIKDAEETKDAKFRHLVDVLANMKSKQAAAVLETLDPKIAVRVLSGMRGRQAGEILTFVKPEIAAQLTESLARMQLPLD